MNNYAVVVVVVIVVFTPFSLSGLTIICIFSHFFSERKVGKIESMDMRRVPHLLRAVARSQ